MIGTVEKAVLAACCAAGIALLLALWQPTGQLTLEYYRGEALKYARMIERGEEFKVSLPVAVERGSAVVSISLPNEEPLIIEAPVSRLRIPHPDAPGGLLYGEEKEWSHVRSVRVLEEPGFLLVEWIPQVEVAESSCGGLRVVEVRVKLFDVEVELLEPGGELHPLRTSKLEYCRAYDHERDGAVSVNSTLAGTFAVSRGEALRVTVMREEWG
ncbi:MAG: hypothetical protein QFX33_00225 [Candidatus Nezhaarchaeota archaeon]|nr:hypothetical protein [Candidatus Nezhaarchaeota archaeon]